MGKQKPSFWVSDVIIQEHGELERYKIQNAKLRKELEAEHALAETLGHFHEAAKAENAKLRKLVRGLNYCLSRRKFVSCERCPLYDATDVNIEPKCVRMMRELGIEVNND